METGGLFEMRKGKKKAVKGVMNFRPESAFPKMKVRKVKSRKGSFLP